PVAERGQTGHGDNEAAANQLPAIVVVGARDGGGDPGQVVPAGDGVVAVTAVPVQRQEAGQPVACPGAGQEEVGGQRSAALGGEDDLLAAVVLPLGDTADDLPPFPGRLVRAQELAERCREGGLPRAALVGRRAGETLGQWGCGGLPGDPLE